MMEGVSTFQASLRHEKGPSLSPRERVQQQREQRRLQKRDTRAGTTSIALPRRPRPGYGERYRLYYHRCAHLQNQQQQATEKAILSFDQWLAKTKQEEAAHEKQKLKNAEDRYEALRRQQQQKLSSNRGGSTSFEALNAREVEKRLVHSKREMGRVRDQVRACVQDRRE